MLALQTFNFVMFVVMSIQTKFVTEMTITRKNITAVGFLCYFSFFKQNQFILIFLVHFNNNFNHSLHLT